MSWAAVGVLNGSWALRMSDGMGNRQGVGG